MFDYSNLPEQTRNDVLAAAAAIRDHAAGALGAAIEIGRCLACVKAALPYGEFGGWLAAEFPRISDRHARRLMAISERFGRLTSDTVSDLAVGTLAVLAESDLSDEQFANALEAGPITRSQARQIVHEATEPETMPVRRPTAKIPELAADEVMIVTDAAPPRPVRAATAPRVRSDKPCPHCRGTGRVEE